MPTLMRHLLFAIVLLSAPHARVLAQQPYASFEFQFGAQFPLSSVRYTGPGAFTQAPGLSMGALIYSYLENPVGFRIRADIAFNSITAWTADANSSKGQTDYSVGVDVSPRFSRVVVRGAEARFYAGTALRLVDRADDVCIWSGPWCDDTRLVGRSTDLVGRAGWFIRKQRRASMLRLDVSYQFGRFSIMRHELLVRLGLG